MNRRPLPLIDYITQAIVGVGRRFKQPSYSNALGGGGCAVRSGDSDVGAAAAVVEGGNHG